MPATVGIMEYQMSNIRQDMTIQSISYGTPEIQNVPSSSSTSGASSDERLTSPPNGARIQTIGWVSSSPQKYGRQATFPTSFVAVPPHSFPPRQMSLPTTVTPESNGFIGGQPLTTSQHHPPKFRLLHRSSAILSSPTPDSSQAIEVLDQTGSAEDVGQGSLPAFADDPTGQIDIDELAAAGFGGMSPDRPSLPNSKDSSFDYKDSSGIDLHEFIVKTLRENPRDRLMLLKLERDFTGFIQDLSRVVFKYPPMTSYHRMLVHRVAAYFGLDHNVDQTGKCVIVNKTATTRIPEISFQVYCSREYSDEELSRLPRSILKRSNTASSEECLTPPRLGSPSSNSRKSMEDKKSKSIEEREVNYEKARARIFNQDSTSSQSSLEGAETSNSQPQESPSPTTIATTSLVTTTTETTTRQSNLPPRFQAWENQRISEREAAIAAAALATGGKVPLISKKPPDRPPSVERFFRYPQPQARLQQQQQQPLLHGVSTTWAGEGTIPAAAEQLSWGAYAPSTPTSMVGAATPGTSQTGVYVGVPTEGLSPGAAVWINPATGTPVLNHDGTPVVYQTGYPTSGRPVGVVYAPTHPGLQQQQQQHQQQQQQQQQQSSYPFSVPLQYQYSPQQQHYYVVQQSQATRQPVQQGQEVPSIAQHGSVLGHPPQMPSAYPDVTSQMTTLSLSRHEVLEDDTASVDSYPSSPPTPDLQHQVVISGGSYVVVPSPRSVLQGQMYQGHSMPVVPLQYVQGQGYQTPHGQGYQTPHGQSYQTPHGQGYQTPHGQSYQTPQAQSYQTPQAQSYQNPYAQNQFSPYVTAAERGSPYPQSATPPMPQRSASPVMLGHTYVSNTPPSQQSLGRPSPVQTPTPPFTRTPPPSTVAPLIRTAVPSAPAGPMFIPVSGASVGGSPAVTAGSPHQVSSVSQPYWRSQQGRKGTKALETVHPDILRYQALAVEGQRIQGLHGFPGGQQRPPLIQMIPVPQPYPYMTGHRFLPNQHLYSHQVMHPQPSYRKSRPPRQPTRTPKQNPTTDDHKTVNHILEVYDLPEGLSASETETLLKDVEQAGGRILRINNSTSGPQNNTGPTVLAIFKSATDAQRALETIKNPKFKLRVSQKSTTHITGDNSTASAKSNSYTSSS